LAKYIVSGTITISALIEVEADNEQEAREKAEDSPVISLCHYCADKSPDCEWVTSGDLDGTPVIDCVKQLKS
jgi:hypothetical protein